MSAMKTFVIAALAAAAQAHMVMREPAIFAASGSPTRNGPLAEDGSDYPCHMSSPDYTRTSETTYSLGSTQTLAFTGSAVHGGGSCQISITYDQAPTKSSVFKVIHSIEGGCPAKNQAGNLVGDATLQTPDTYQFPIPSDIPAGKVVLAWSWLNRIGNREFYMNCAPVTLTGTGGSIDNFNKLPDMMVANIGSKQCTVAEGTDVKFPNPGNSVDQFPFTPGTFQDVSNQPGCSYNYMAGSGPGQATGGSSAVAPTATTTRAASATSVPGGIFITTSAGGSKPTTSAADSKPTTTAAASSTKAAATTTKAAATSTQGATSPSSTANPGSGNTSGYSAGTACSTEGQFVCTGTGYQQCASGTWTAVRPLAAGTGCTPGEGASLDIYDARLRRKDGKAPRRHSRTHPRSFRA